MSAGFLDTVLAELSEIAPIAAFFIALALILGRRRAIVGFFAARGEIATNIGLLAINVFIVIPLVAGSAAALREAMPRFALLGQFWEALPWLLTLLVAIIAIDFGAYWRHRWEHAPALWPIHATHHADEAMNWLSVRRKHPLGEMLSMFCDLLPAFLLGLPIWAIAVAAILRSWWGYFIHVDAPWTLGPLGRILISPAAHRLHHIRDEALMGSNYGNTITLWDKMFGTYVDPALYLGCETGIAEGTRGLLGEIARPFEARYWRRSGGNAGGEALIGPTQNTP